MAGQQREGDELVLHPQLDRDRGRVQGRDARSPRHWLRFGQVLSLHTPAA